MITRLKMVSHHLTEQLANWVGEDDVSIIVWVSLVPFFVQREQ